MTLTEEGIAVVDGDEWLSKQIRHERRLDVFTARALADMMQPFVPVGGVVADIGACLGDQTVCYAGMVGPMGHVHAFEPNQVSFDCLRYNMRNHPQVECYQIALADHTSRCVIGPEPNNLNNLGMATIHKEVPDGPVLMTTLDALSTNWSRLDFVKIDVEGVEAALLAGAVQTFATWKPPLVIEVNRGALANHGAVPRDVYRRLDAWGYVFLPICNTLGTMEPMKRIEENEVDVVCVPREHALSTGFLSLA